MNQRRRTGPLALGIVLALALLSGGLATTDDGIIATQAQSDCTRTLSPDQSIQNAIDDAESAAVVCLEEGTWTEHLTIETSLTLRGIGPDRSVIAAVEEDRPVLSLVGEADLIAKKLDVTGGNAGFNLSENAQATIQNSTVSGNRSVGVGISLRDSAQVEIRNSTVSQELNGIILLGSAEATIHDSTVSNNGDGIALGAVRSDTAHAEIIDNTISDNDKNGIDLGGSAGATIRGNRIERNAGSGIASTSKGDVEGGGNVMRGNGVDLKGNLPGSLREPVVEPTEDQIVYPAEDYPTLQHALDALRAGGELTLRDGTQTAGLTIAKELSLRPQNGTSVTLQAKTSGAPGLSLVSGAQLTARQLRVTEGNRGIVLGSDAEATFRDVDVSANERGGLLMDGSAEATFRDVDVLANKHVGLLMDGSAKARVRDSTISESGTDGIVLRGSAQITIRNSIVADGGEDGIELRDSSEATIRDSTVFDNDAGSSIGFFSLGIVLSDSAQADIRDSAISENTVGIELRDSAQAEIRGNDILRNHEYGIRLSETPCDNTDQTFMGVVEGGANTFDGNEEGAVCPSPELDFLTTEEGGELDRTE